MFYFYMDQIFFWNKSSKGISSLFLDHEQEYQLHSGVTLPSIHDDLVQLKR